MDIAQGLVPCVGAHRPTFYKPVSASVWVDPMPCYPPQSPSPAALLMRSGELAQGSTLRGYGQVSPAMATQPSKERAE
jgi:hypothetical protein